MAFGIAKRAVINKDEIENYVCMGLGRGINSTDPTPWKNKSSFQVRHPVACNLIGTEESGLIQTYKSTVVSAADLQMELKASVFVPNIPVRIGLDAEMCRSSTQSRKIFGQKVINRTISFRLDVLDKSAVKDSPSGKEESHIFEGVLCKWMINRLKEEGYMIENSEKDVVSALNDFIKTSSKEASNMVFDLCGEFIDLYGITHYVSAITLGTSRHIIFTQEEYAVALKAGLNASAISMAFSDSKIAASTKTVKWISNTQEIGKIINGMVSRGTDDEQVVEIQVVPIHSLVQSNRILHLGMLKALKDYTTNTKDTTGPFIIQCGDEEMFWKVNSEDNSLTITEDKNTASAFYVFPFSDTDDEYDFSIRYKGSTVEEALREGKDSVKLTRYLEVKPNLCGYNQGPLKIKSTLNIEDSQLVIYSQLLKSYFHMPSKLTPWIEKKEAFFISSATIRGYVAAVRQKVTSEVETAGIQRNFIFKCVPSTSYHDEKNAWMLFRLLHPTSSITKSDSGQMLKAKVNKMLQMT